MHHCHPGAVQTGRCSPLGSQGYAALKTYLAGDRAQFGFRYDLPTALVRLFLPPFIFGAEFLKIIVNPGDRCVELRRDLSLADQTGQIFCATPSNKLRM